MDQFEPKTDHDLLITLHSEMRGLRTDIQNLGEGLSTKVNDHESRIRSLEKSVEFLAPVPTNIEKLSDRVIRQEKITDKLDIKMVFGVAVASFVMTFISALLLAWFKKQVGL